MSAIGLVGGWLLRQASRRGWSTAGSEPIAILGLALAAYYGSVAVGGNGFISAFVAGVMSPYPTVVSVVTHQ